MAEKAPTPPAPIKPEFEYRKIIYKLIDSIVKTRGEISETEVTKAIDRLPFLFSQVKDYNERKFKKLLVEAVGKKKANGLYGLVNQSAIDILRDVFLSVNVGLIKSVSNDASARIMREIAKDPKDLAPIIDRIQAAGNLTRSRARTIARTEVAKLNADMSRVKSIALGVTEYEWRTAGDERVRDRHADCDGKIYKYGQQTDTDSGEEPAQEVNCRCVAINIISDDVLGQIL